MGRSLSNDLPFGGLAEFYKLKDEDDSQGFVSRAIREITFEDTVKDIHDKQRVEFNVSEVNGYLECEVIANGEPKGVYYLGDARKADKTQSILTYVMFNALYSENPEQVLEYEFALTPTTPVLMLGALYSEKLREIMNVIGGTKSITKYHKNPCILTILVKGTGKPLLREFLFDSLEDMQNTAQAIRAFAFNQVEAFKSFVSEKDDEQFSLFLTRQWGKNSGSAETLFRARDKYYADKIIKEDQDSDLVVDDREGTDFSRGSGSEDTAIGNTMDNHE